MGGNRVDQSKFALNISKYLVRFSELDLDIYDFRKQDFEDEEDLRHHILLCKELAYFERKRLQEVGFKFDEEWLLSGQEPYSRIKVALKTLYFIGSYVWRKFKGKLKNKRILYKKYTDYHEFFSDHLHKYPFKGAGDRYVLTSYVSSRIEVL